MTLKNIGHLSYAASGFVHYFIAIGEFKLELQSENSQFGSKSTIFLIMWPWNLTDDLEKWQGTSPKHHQTLCVISSPYMNPTRVTVQKRPNCLFFLPVTLTYDLDLFMDVTFVIGNNPWKFQNDTMMETWLTDGWTDRTIHRAAWSQLKKEKCQALN